MITMVILLQLVVGFTIIRDPDQQTDPAVKNENCGENLPRVGLVVLNVTLSVFRSEIFYC